MLTIVWNPREFHLTKVLENGCAFNAGHYVAEILESLSQWRSIKAAGNEQELLVHADMRARTPPSYQLNIFTRIE
jgi:hypothetical protein